VLARDGTKVIHSGQGHELVAQVEITAGEIAVEVVDDQHGARRPRRVARDQ